jgi:hypothetical protein
MSTHHQQAVTGTNMDDPLPIQLDLFLSNLGFTSVIDLSLPEEEEPDEDVKTVEIFFDENGEPNF